MLRRFASSLCSHELVLNHKRHKRDNQLKVKSDTLNVVEVSNRVYELTEGKVESGFWILDLWFEICGINSVKSYYLILKKVDISTNKYIF